MAAHGVDVGRRGRLEARPGCVHRRRREPAAELHSGDRVHLMARMREHNRAAAYQQIKRRVMHNPECQLKN